MTGVAKSITTFCDLRTKIRGTTIFTESTYWAHYDMAIKDTGYPPSEQFDSSSFLQ